MCRLNIFASQTVASIVIQIELVLFCSFVSININFCVNLCSIIVVCACVYLMWCVCYIVDDPFSIHINL